MVRSRFLQYFHCVVCGLFLFNAASFMFSCFLVFVFFLVSLFFLSAVYRVFVILFFLPFISELLLIDRFGVSLVLKYDEFIGTYRGCMLELFLILI